MILFFPLILPLALLFLTLLLPVLPLTLLLDLSLLLGFLFALFLVLPPSPLMLGLVVLHPLALHLIGGVIGVGILIGVHRPPPLLPPEGDAVEVGDVVGAHHLL